MFDNPLHDTTWKTLDQRWGDLTFDELSVEEREVISLFWLEGEIFNGGLDQYFHNSSGDLAPYAISGLRRIGARQTLALFESAIGKLNVVDYPTDRSVRKEVLKKLGYCDDDRDPFEAESDAMIQLPERFFELSLEALASTYRAGNVQLRIGADRKARRTAPGHGMVFGIAAPGKYFEGIKQYCDREGIAIPLGFGRLHSPGRFVAIDMDKSPPRLIALTWSKHSDLVYYLRIAGSVRRFRLLDFEDREELLFDGQGSLEKGSAF
jgi:hypothetical protein